MVDGIDREARTQALIQIVSRRLTHPELSADDRLQLEQFLRDLLDRLDQGSDDSMA